MSDSAVNVTIGAKLDDLLNGFKVGEKAVTDSMRGIAESVNKSSNAVEAAMREMTEAMQRTKRESQETSGGMMGAFGEVGGFMKNVLGGIVAGFSLRAAMDEIGQFADRAESLGNTAQIIGSTATELSRLHASATPVGIATEQVDKGMMRLARTMSDATRGGEEQVKAFAALGISAEELKSMSIPDVIARIADKFKGSEDGATKSAVAMALMGRSGAELIPWLNQGSEAMTEMADEAQALGAVMGEDAVAAGSALDDQLDRLGIKSQGLKNQFSQELAPALGFIADMFTEGSGTATSFGDVFKGIATIVVGATAIVKGAWEIISSIVRSVSVTIFSIIDAIAMVAQGDFTGAIAALETGRDMMFETMTGMVDNIGALKDKTASAFEGIWSDAVPAPPTAVAEEEAKGSIEFEGKGTGGGGADKAAEEKKRAAKAAFDYQMELLRNEMAELERGSAEKVALAQRMTEMTKAQFGEESREYARAKRDEVRVVQEAEAEKRRITDTALQAARDHANLSIQMEKGRADYLVATGKMTAVQRQQVERESEEQLYAMQLSYLEQRLALYALEPKEAERINGEIERLKGEHMLRMQQVDIATFQANKAQWDGYFQTLVDGFGNAIQGMVFQGQTLQDAMGNILQSILGQLIQTGVKMLANWAATQLGMTAATVTGAAARTTAEVASAKASTVANAGAAIKNIMTKAAEVFANVYNAIAGIPYIGPFLAPVMAVAAGAAVVGMVGKVASAEGGWDRVPYDGARAILHKEEMVLPGPLAEGIRQMVESGGNRGGGGVTIHALDRKDVQRYFDDNSELIYGAMTNHAMNNPGGF